MASLDFSSNTGSAVVLGVIEGLTEFLPISSTGHMILVGHLLGFTGEKAETFEIFIQLGAILAVVWLYFSRFLGLLPLSVRATIFSIFGKKIEKNETPQEGLSDIRGLVLLAVACLPVFILGFLFHKKIKALLFAPIPVALALIFGGVALIFIERRRQVPQTTDLDSITIRQAISVGIFQCLALWPGISRSGSMIFGGLFLGMNRITAAEFSFLVAVPVMAVATLYDLYKSRHLIESGDLQIFLIGFVVAFVTAVIAIRFFLNLLRKFSLEPFGWYRIALGSVVILSHLFFQ